MSILAKQNIYGNALVRQTYEIKRPGGGALDEGFGRGDVVTAQEKAAIEEQDAGYPTEFGEEITIAPSQRSGAFGGPTSYENSTQKGTARYYKADGEAPGKTDKSSYTVPDNATGPYNGTSSRNIVADDPGGTTRLSMFAKGAGAINVAAANTLIGENGLTVGNKQAVGLDEGTGGNNSRAAISFLGGGYNEWINIGNVRSGAYGVTKTSGGHEFRNSNSPTNRYRIPSAAELDYLSLAI